MEITLDTKLTAPTRAKTVEEVSVALTQFIEGKKPELEAHWRGLLEGIEDKGEVTLNDFLYMFRQSLDRRIKVLASSRGGKKEGELRQRILKDPKDMDFILKQALSDFSITPEKLKSRIKEFKERWGYEIPARIILYGSIYRSHKVDVFLSIIKRKW